MTDPKLAHQERTEPPKSHRWTASWNAKFGAKIWFDDRPMFAVIAGIDDSRVTADDPVPQWQKCVDAIIDAQPDVGAPARAAEWQPLTKHGEVMTEKTQRPTDGPWVWTTFSKPSGEPIVTVEDVAEVIAGSARHSELAELWGVSLEDGTLNPDGCATVVCYTGNGPNAHNNARVIAAVPQMIAFIRHLLARDHGFVYSRDEKDAIAIIDHIDGHGSLPPCALTGTSETPRPADLCRCGHAFDWHIADGPCKICADGGAARCLGFRWSEPQR